MSFLVDRISKFESSVDNCTQDIWVYRESRWFLALSNDLCELSQIAGLFNYWDNAWKTVDSCKRRAAVIPSFLITMKNAMSACYSKRKTHDSFLTISPESRKRVTPSCCRKTACRLKTKTLGWYSLKAPVDLKWSGPKSCCDKVSLASSCLNYHLFDEWSF